MSLRKPMELEFDRPIEIRVFWLFLALIASMFALGLLFGTVSGGFFFGFVLVIFLLIVLMIESKLVTIK